MRFVKIAAVKPIFGLKLNITLLPTFFVRIWTKPGKRNDFRTWTKRTAPFWVITQRVAVISYLRFGTT